MASTRTTLEKTCLKNCLRKEYYYYDDDDDERYKKMPFLSISVLQLFVCWRSLGNYPGLEICWPLQVYLEVESSDNQLVEKAVKALN